MGDFVIDSETLQNLSQLYKEYRNFRGEPDPLLDQYFITKETALNRALVFDPKNYDGKRLVMIGDMDLISLFIGKVSKPKDLAVIDIDKRLPELVFKLKFKEKIRSIRFINHDIRVRMLAVMKNQFEYVFIEPPFTIEGLELGLSRAVQCARKDAKSYIVLSWDYHKKSIEIVENFVDKMKLELLKVNKDFNNYTYLTPLNKKVSNVFVIKVNSNSTETISNHYFGPLYYRESKETPKSYRCKCGNIITVGEGGDFKNLRELEEHGCPKCGYSGKFIYNSNVPII